MIYLEHHSGKQVMLIPNNGRDIPAAPVEIVFRSTISKTSTVSIRGIMRPEDSLYVAIELTLAKASQRGYDTALAVGEYEYEVKRNQQVLSSGLLQIGDYKRATKDGSATGVSFKQGK